MPGKLCRGSVSAPKTSLPGFWLTALAILLLSGGAALPRHVQKSPTEALAHPEATALGRLLGAEEPNKNLSGVHLAASGEEALADLLTLADHAERTIDAQYYIFQQDESARVLM